MNVFAVFGFDKWIALKDFLGVFSTHEKAQEFIDNHFADFEDKKVPIYKNYQVKEITLDIPCE